MHEATSFLFIFFVTAFVLWSTQRRGFFRKLYQWVPPVLLLYLLPAIATNSGLVTSGQTLRALAMNTLLPISLLMLTAIVYIPDLLRVTRKGLFIFLAGTLGIVLGGPLALFIAGFFQPQLLIAAGSNAPWRGLVCITGSWINGTPGQLSMKEVYGSSEGLFLTALATDIILQNIWLFFLLYSVKFHTLINVWLTKKNIHDYDLIDDKAIENKRLPFIFPSLKTWGVLAVAYIIVVFASNLCADFFLKNIGADERNTWSFLTKKSLWLVLYSTSFGIGLSFTAFFKTNVRFWTVLGNGILFFIIATIGLQLNLQQIKIDTSFFGIGVLWLLIHLAILVIAAKLLKAPWHYIAIGSEANIGGPASASIVASSFHPSLASMGILLGVMSNVIGNYANLLAGALFQLIVRIY